MSAASNYTEANVINSLLRGAAFPVPSTVYIGLHTADPGEAGDNEVSTGNWPAYVRKDAAVGGATSSGWDAPSDGVTHNAKQITYPGMNGASNVTVSHWALYDAATGGNMLAHAALQTARTLQLGDVFVFDIGSLTVTMA